MRVVIAEDSAVLRDGMAQLLADRGHEVTATLSDGDGLERAVAETSPDLAIVDVRMPPTSHPDVGVLVFSQWVETRYAAELLAGRANGVGYLLKDRVVDTDDFMEALDRVAHGGTALDPEVVRQLVGASRRRDGLDRLTRREREVLDQMAQGRSNAAIAGTLFVTERAVEKHVGSIFAKLDLPPSEADHRRVLAVLRYLES